MMSLLVNKIIRSLIDQRNEVNPTAIFHKHCMIEKTLIVDVNQVPIRIKLSDESYTQIITKMQLGVDKNFIE